MSTLWYASNAIAAVLLARLWYRGVLPWFQTFLAVMVGQAIALAQVPQGTRSYASLWTATELLIVAMEAASVLELVGLLLRGRLNTTLAGLRWFGLVIWVGAFTAALLPLLSHLDGGWGNPLQVVLRIRGYLSCGMLVFLTIASWILVRQPMPVLAGLLLHARFLAANFGLMATSMFLGAYLPGLSRYSTALMLAGSAVLFAGWTWVLWKAPVTPPREDVDGDSSQRATEQYRKFRDNVRSLHD